MSKRINLDICLIKMLPEEEQPPKCQKCAGYDFYCENYLPAGFEKEK